MAIIEDNNFLTIKKAVTKFNVELDDVIDDWLSSEVQLFYLFQGEKIRIKRKIEPEEISLKIAFKYIQKYQQNYNKKNVFITDFKLDTADDYIEIKFNAYGYFLILPMKSTIRVEDTIKIITEEKVKDRSNLGLLTHGYCHIFTPDKSDCLIFDEIDSIEGLEYPIEKLFISKNEINKFIPRSEIDISTDPRYWASIAIYTQNYYIKQNIFIPKLKLAAKIASVTGKGKSTIMKDWLDDTRIKIERDFKGTNKHGNKPIGNFDLFDPKTGAKLIF